MNTVCSTLVSEHIFQGSGLYFMLVIDQITRNKCTGLPPLVYVCWTENIELKMPVTKKVYACAYCVIYTFEQD